MYEVTSTSWKSRGCFSGVGGQQRNRHQSCCSRSNPELPSPSSHLGVSPRVQRSLVLAAGFLLACCSPAFIVPSFTMDLVKLKLISWRSLPYRIPVRDGELTVKQWPPFSEWGYGDRQMQKRLVGPTLPSVPIQLLFPMLALLATVAPGTPHRLGPTDVEAAAASRRPLHRFPLPRATRWLLSSQQVPRCLPLTVFQRICW